MAFQVMLNQVFVLFILIGVGYAIYKFGMLKETGVQQITSILCYIVAPCIIIYAFQMKYTTSMLSSFFTVMAATFGIHIFTIILSNIIFNKKVIKDDQNRACTQFASIYSNSGFMGYPLVQAIAGTTGLFYGVAYNTVFNILCWSHGIILYSGKTNKKAMLKLIVNPNIIAAIVGLILFRFSIHIPGPIFKTMKYISDLNAPLSMIIIGTSISQVPLKKMFTSKYPWIVTFIRNLAVPFIFMFALHAAGFGGNLLLCTVILAGCPVAGVTVLFANLMGKNPEFPSKLLTVSTLMSIITVPLVVCAINILKF